MKWTLTCKKSNTYVSKNYTWKLVKLEKHGENFTWKIGRLSEMLRLVLIRLPGVNFPLKWDTTHEHQLHPAIAWNLIMRDGICFAIVAAMSGLLCFSGLFDRHLSTILRIPLDTIISSKTDWSQRLCQGCLSWGCKSVSWIYDKFWQWVLEWWGESSEIFVLSTRLLFFFH